MVYVLHSVELETRPLCNGKTATSAGLKPKNSTEKLFWSLKKVRTTMSRKKKKNQSVSSMWSKTKKK